MVGQVIPWDDGAPLSGGSCSRVTLTSGCEVARTGAVMRRRTFDGVDLMGLFVHGEAGRSQVQIGGSLGLDPEDGPEVLGPRLSRGVVAGRPERRGTSRSTSSQTEAWPSSRSPGPVEVPRMPQQIR